jgi:acyl-CoA synthetase (AMP-forming)/AMP-acid ligase II
LLDHPEVDEVCVLGIKDEKMGEEVAAYVIPK